MTGRSNSAASANWARQRPPLLIHRDLVPVVVQPDLTDGDHLGMVRQITQLRHGVVIEVGAVVRMNAHRCVDVRVAFGQGQHPVTRVQINGGIDDQPHPRLSGPSKHRVAVGVELAEIQMAVRVGKGWE